MDFKQAAKVLKEGYKKGYKIIVQKRENDYLVSDCRVMLQAPESFFQNFDRAMIPSLPVSVGESFSYQKGFDPTKGPDANNLLNDSYEKVKNLDCQLTKTGLFAKQEYGKETWMAEFLQCYQQDFITFGQEKYLAIFDCEEMQAPAPKAPIVFLSQEGEPVGILAATYDRGGNWQESIQDIAAIYRNAGLRESQAS